MKSPQKLFLRISLIEGNDSFLKMHTTSNATPAINSLKEESMNTGKLLRAMETP
jgi:hypothetical protein